MRRVKDDTADQPGHDSFLDIVANIVGILILLVMVMGLRASYLAVSDEALVAGADSNPSEPVSDEQLRDALRTAVATEHDVSALVRRVVHVRQETMLRQQERAWLTEFIAAAEEELENQRAELDQQQRQEFDLRRQLADAHQTLDNLTREQVSLLSQAPEVEEVECLPTPLAKTVTGDEVHLRLAAGHVAVIPLDELREEFQTHAERNVWRLRDENNFVGTVGPIGGFRLRYRLTKNRVAIYRQSGQETHTTVVRLAFWELLPSSPQLGEPTDQALLPGADLQQALKELPKTTTVTIWTYPDSFADFRRLKRALFELGYAAAGRPLPEGILIGASPYGSKSAAQ